MFGALPDHIIEDRRLSHADIRVLLAMSLHANAKTGKAWPKANKLAERLGMSRSTVMSSLGKCVRLGLLTKQSRSANGLRIAMEYTFQFERFDSQRTSLSCDSTSLTDEKTSLYPSADIVVRAEVQQEQTSEQTKEQTQDFVLEAVAKKPRTKRKTKPKAPPVADNPPTLEEIQRYACDAGNKNRIGVTRTFAAKFALYYGDDWTLKNGEPLRDWRRAVSGWVLRDADKNPMRHGETNTFIPESARRRRGDFGGLDD